MIVTTREQSLRLLKSGLKAESADFAWAFNPYSGDELHIKTPLVRGDIPCWSLSRLWDLLNKSGLYFYEYSTSDSVEAVLESLVAAVERFARQKRI